MLVEIYDFNLYRAALAADDAFSAELARVYGKARAGDARYDPERNRATPRLVELSDAVRAACSAWLAEMRKHRNA